jgi:hypothetical protein
MPTIAAIMGCASAINKRPEDDFFETPAWVTEQLCAVERIPRLVWEPCSGGGAIARILQRRGVNVLESDLTPRNGQQKLDFLATREALAPALITNPPYKHATKFIRQAHSLGIRYVALLLKADFLNAQERRQLVDDVGYPTPAAALANRIFRRKSEKVVDRSRCNKRLHDRKTS